MKWLLFAHRATRRQHRLHGCSSLRYFHDSYPIRWSKSCQMQCSSSLFLGRYYSTSMVPNVVGSSYRISNDNKLEKSIKNVDLEIISRENIKPSSPTPHHLRTYNLSIVDQHMFDVYTPLILFLPNNDGTDVTDVVTKRSKHLKESLSKILTRFYPLAGKVKDNLQIECNDEGIYYIEARVKQTLQDFLYDPDDVKVRELLPERPCTAETSVGNYVIGIQVNIFLCGGIGISTSMSHKIFDGHTYYVFMKAWAAAARSSSDTILPSFVANEMFPNNPCSKHDTWPSKLMATKPLRTKRLVFDSRVLPLLKAQPVSNNPSSTHRPTRMEATTAVIWKAMAKARSKAVRPHALLVAVNFRKRASPPLPEYSIGNLVDGVAAICFPERQMDLPTLMGELRESIAKINPHHVDSMKVEKGRETFKETMRKAKQVADATGEGGFVVATSLLNSGIYSLDFGWAKPIWLYVVNPGYDRFLVLNETVKGGGVEAVVTLSPEEMEIFERDPELLSYATINTSPL